MTIPQMYTPSAMGQLLTEAGAVYGATEADQAWAQLHGDIFRSHLYHDTPECCQTRARIYSRFATQYPAYADVANTEAARCMAAIEQ